MKKLNLTIIAAIALICCSVYGDTMSTAENGLPTNILSNFVGSSSIASSTFAAPIVITTSAPHGLTNGDWVSVANHEVNWAANGLWQATVLSPTTLRLVGSSGIAVGANTGSVTPRSIGPTFAIPADGVDNIAAASVNVPFNALADRTAALGLLTGAFSINNIGISTNNDDTDGVWDSFNIVASNTWTNITGATVWRPQGAANVYVGDLIAFDAQFQQSIFAGANNLLCQLQLWYGIQNPGGTPAWIKVPASTSGFQLVTANTVVDSHPHLQGLVTVTTPGILNVRILARAISAGAMPVNWQMVGDYSVRDIVYRGTNYPQ
jgi:hypothetical protein